MRKPLLSDVAKAAIAYYRAGLTVIPVKLDGSKAPAVDSWEPYKSNRPTEKTVSVIFGPGDPRGYGIAILGGAVSGGLEIIDFDHAESFDEWAELVECQIDGLVARLPKVKTPSGYHVYFRSAKPEGNQKLARSRDKLPGKKGNTKIETRGEGGYVIAPPSPPSVHESGIAYAMMPGPALTEIPMIGDDERKMLLDSARAFNEVAEREDKKSGASARSDPARAGDDFDTRGEWAMILEPHGWRRVRSRGAVTHWRRPGKDIGISATTGYCGDKLYVFSSNADPFEPGHAYGKFSTFGRLNHNSDFIATAKALGRLGYGAKQQRQVNGPPETQEPAVARHLHPVQDPEKDPLDARALERAIADSKSVVCKQPMLSQLIAIRANDLGRWAELEDVLRETKMLRHFKKASDRLTKRTRVPRNLDPDLSAAVERGARANREIIIRADLEAMNNEGLDAVQKAGVAIFKRDGRLVHVAEDGGKPSISALGPERLREHLASSACWIRIGTNRDGDEIEQLAPPPKDSAAAILQRGMWPSVRRLASVVEVPIIRKDGTVVLTEGHDPETEVVYSPLAKVEPHPDPTLEEAKMATDELLDIVVDFPFAEPTHKAAWLAALLTPFARFAYSGPTPLFLIDANTQGSGKTKLASLINRIALGREATILTPSKQEDEDRKRVMSIALSGQRLAIIDNAEHLGGTAMAAMLTSTRISDRILGESRTVDAELSATWIATANNARLDRDLSRRVCVVRIESDMERPEDRSSFKHPKLDAMVGREWPRLAGHALTILRAYYTAGKPDCGAKTWGSFEGWAELIPNVVMWLGLADPTIGRKEAIEANDSEREIVLGFLREFAKAERSGATLRDVLQACAPGSAGTTHGELADYIRQLCPTRGSDFPTAMQLGKAMLKLKGRVVGDYRLSCEKNRIGVAHWRVTNVRQADLPLDA